MADDTVWPADKVERWPIDKLTPYARNARTHDEVQVAKLAASIKEWGWTVPVLVDEEGVLIAGHGRILAAQKLEIETVPVMVARGWSETKKRAYVIADNRLAEDAGWDKELLTLELQALIDESFSIGLTGFNMNDLDELIEGFDSSKLDTETKDQLPSPNSGQNKTLLLTFGKRKVPITEAELEWMEQQLDQHVEEFGMSSGFVEQTLNHSK